MRLMALALAACAAAFAGTASADEVVLDVKAPTMAETEEAGQDWFRAFTSGTVSKGADLWRIEPDRDVNFKWVKGDRWQLNIDLKSRSDDSPLPREEVSAGATFRLTPRISIGGSVSIGAEELERDEIWKDEELEAGVRLKSAFKF